MSANLLLENLGTQLVASQVKRSQLLMKYDPSYPLVKQADQEIAVTQEAIANAENTATISAAALVAALCCDEVG